MIKKLKLWLTKTGLTNIGYLVAALGSILIGSKLLLGASLGIFIYINYNVIQKLILDKFKDLK